MTVSELVKYDGGYWNEAIVCGCGGCGGFGGGSGGEGGVGDGGGEVARYEAFMPISMTPMYAMFPVSGHIVWNTNANFEKTPNTVVAKGPAE